MKKAHWLPVTFLTTLLLVGCGGGGSSESSGDSSEVKIIKVWTHKSSEEPEGAIYNQLKNNFNRQEFKTSTGKTIRMTMEFYGATLEDKINGSILTGGLPDIIAVDSSDIAAKANAGILVDFQDQITAEEKSSYIDSVINAGSIDNKLYSLSAMEAPGGLYYNKELLKSVGIEENSFGTYQAPWSWKDVKNAMVKLKQANKKYQIKLNFGFGDDGFMYLYSPLVYSAGATFGTDDHVKAALTTDNAVAGIAQMEMFFDRTNLSSQESWVYNGSNENAFGNEEIAFQIYGPWDVRTIEKNNLSVKGKYGVMPYPVFEQNGTKSSIIATPSGSYGFGITRNAKDKEAAAIALKYLTNAEAGEMLYNQIGTFPTNKQLLQTMEPFQSGPSKSLADYLMANTFTRPKMIKYPQLKDAYGKVLSYIKNKDQVSNYDLKKKIAAEMQIVDDARG